MEKSVNLELGLKHRQSINMKFGAKLVETKLFLPINKFSCVIELSIINIARANKVICRAVKQLLLVSTLSTKA